LTVIIKAMWWKAIQESDACPMSDGNRVAEITVFGAVVQKKEDGIFPKI
jgi:hypothetical protein